MKRIFFYLIFSFLAVPFVQAQAASFSELRQLVYASNPDLEINDHLIAFNVWKISDEQSRASNLAFGKAFDVYEQAKLKGGSRGLIVVLLNEDNLSTEAVIVLQKDGVKRLLSLPANAITAAKLGTQKNGVYSSDGTLLKSNLPADQVFNFIRSLITR